MPGLYKLNPNQVVNRSRKIRPLLEDADAISVRAVLIDCGVWDRIIGCFGTAGDGEPGADVEQAELDTLYDGMIRAGLQRGDPAIGRLYRDMRDRAAVERNWSMSVHLVPYRVADPTLPRIAREADEAMIREVVVGLLQRARDEKFTEATVVALERGVTAFLDEAAVKWEGSPQEEAPGPAGYDEDALQRMVDGASVDESVEPE
jgi:hypothetical protein